MVEAALMTMSIYVEAVFDYRISYLSRLRKSDLIAVWFRVIEDDPDEINSVSLTDFPRQSRDSIMTSILQYTDNQPLSRTVSILSCGGGRGPSLAKTGRHQHFRTPPKELGAEDVTSDTDTTDIEGF